ncbi:transposase [Novisyntrophococcus fermenticellae]|uniref:transposase n=1 Tax=Novisyntrophococcus fermenticellae TaxID=2068655 RepID=UPI001E4D7052|nr:transposase [Novisyntrophococcus fermenticellae]
MTCYKAYKFRIYPNAVQEELLTKTFGCVRFVYNYYLSLRKAAYQLEKKIISYMDCTKDLVLLKKENGFLREVDSIALQQSLRHLDTAFRNFYSDSKVGYPRYKTRKNSYCSYSTICVNQNIRLDKGYLALPKLGKLKVRQHREIPEGYALKSATICKTPTGKYYASILFEYENRIETVDAHRLISIGFSVEDLFVSSEEIVVENVFQKNHQRSMEKLKIEQERLSRCMRGSNRYTKQKKKVAVVHEKIANQRKDYLHKASRQIANAYDVVCIEAVDINTGLQTSELSERVVNNGWGMFTSFLKYKLEEQGKVITKERMHEPAFPASYL